MKDIINSLRSFFSSKMKPLRPWKDFGELSRIGGVSLGGSASFLPASSSPMEGRGFRRSEIKKINSGICYLNGNFLPLNKAKISLMDLGVLRGYGVFEFLRTYNRKPFALEEHLQRLNLSAKLIGLPLPWSQKELMNLVLTTLSKNSFPEANIRILVTGGPTEDSIHPKSLPSLFIIVSALLRYPQEYYEKGVKVITFRLKRFLPSAKSLNYAAAIIALREAEKEKAVEAIYIDQDDSVLEGTTSNLFLFKKNILITAKENILAGITRGIVLELAKPYFKTQQRTIKIEELKNIDEAFLTATNKEIMPVVQIDDFKVGRGFVGGNTQKIMTLFKKLTSF